MGKVLPVLITVYKDKSFDFVIKTPPAAAQLMELAQLKSGSAQPNRNKVGSVSWDQIRGIAEKKMKDLNAFTVESAMSMVAGTARSMGITVSGDAPWGKPAAKAAESGEECDCRVTPRGRALFLAIKVENAREMSGRFRL